jgi:superfamily II DNA helicase RecQ
MPFTKSEREFLAKQFADIKTRLSVLEDYIQKESIEEEETTDRVLFEKLRTKRVEFTGGNPQIPLYVICNNKTLEEMAKYKPLTIDDLKKIYGMGGDFKAMKYGDGFIKVITDHLLGL